MHAYAIVSLILERNPQANIRPELILDIRDAAVRAGFDPVEVIAVACLHTSWNPFMWGMGLTGYPTSGSLLRTQSMLRYYRPLRGISLATLTELKAPPGTGYSDLSGKVIADAVALIKNASGAEPDEPLPVHPTPDKPVHPADPVRPPDVQPAPVPPAQPEPVKPRRKWVESAVRILRLIDSKPVWFVLGLAVPAPVIHSLDVALDALVLFLQTLIP